MGLTPDGTQFSSHPRVMLIYIYVIHRPGGPYWEKVENCARGLEYGQTEGTVFPNTDRPRPVNNIFIYF